MDRRHISAQSHNCCTTAAKNQPILHKDFNVCEERQPDLTFASFRADRARRRIPDQNYFSKKPLSFASQPLRPPSTIRHASRRIFDSCASASFFHIFPLKFQTDVCFFYFLCYTVISIELLCERGWTDEKANAYAAEDSGVRI